MTAAELNRKIKKVYKKYTDLQKKIPDNYYEEIEIIRKELRGLFYTDEEFNYMNLTSLKIMIIMNNHLNFVPFHRFGLYISMNYPLSKGKRASRVITSANA